jgi:hypothetical protein
MRRRTIFIIIGVTIAFVLVAVAVIVACVLLLIPDPAQHTNALLSFHSFNDSSCTIPIKTWLDIDSPFKSGACTLQGFGYNTLATQLTSTRVDVYWDCINAPSYCPSNCVWPQSLTIGLCQRVQPDGLELVPLGYSSFYVTVISS